MERSLGYEGMNQGRNQEGLITLYIVVGISKLLEFATWLYFRFESLGSDTNLWRPDSTDTGTSLRRIYVGQKCPHVYTLSINVQYKIRVQHKSWYSHMPTIEVQIQSYTSYDNCYTLQVFCFHNQAQKNIYKSLHKMLT